MLLSIVLNEYFFAWRLNTNLFMKNVDYTQSVRETKWNINELNCFISISEVRVNTVSISWPSKIDPSTYSENVTVKILGDPRLDNVYIHIFANRKVILVFDIIKCYLSSRFLFIRQLFLKNFINSNGMKILAMMKW